MQYLKDRHFSWRVWLVKPVMLLLLAFFACHFAGCTNQQNEVSTTQDEPANYPAAPGFNKAASDSMAIALADKVMQAMGGWESWKQTHYLAWTFVGRRRLIWDKFTGDVRINSFQDSLTIILNIHSMEGKAMQAGEILTHPDSLQKYMERGRRIWINDSYWLVMPFKMKDSGVTLNYVGEDTTRAGEAAHVVSLTFEDVGVTPQNKFHAWIDKDSYLVRQWAYFREATQNEPNFIMPWNHYQTYGEILLSGDRGRLQLTDIKVLESVSEEIFSSLEPVKLESKKE